MIAWLLATRAGRYLAIGLAIAAALGLAALKLIATGRSQERARQQADTLTAIRNRKTSDEKVDGLGPDALDRELGKWMRDGNG
ncbi:MAG: hypothetical protein P0Y66_22080 [Candidatus Kaistia colombiensis]|nr:MAG: hypothetical protein P0Y66_22080 [Kaistia sp.]